MRRAMKRLTILAVVLGLLSSGCGIVGGGSDTTYHAVFSRAVQLFESGRVRVLGVDVGTVSDIDTRPEGVAVTFTVSDDVKLPADVKAAIVPVSLLGERYIQLYPAYTSGPTLPAGSVIGEDRTTVPAEPDELLRSLQDYLGALDPQTVSRFVDNAAQILRGNGTRLNNLIHHGTAVLEELSSKRSDLAQIIVQFDKVSRALATRQKAIAGLIHSYNDVAGTLVTNRVALEGTVSGLRDAALELSSLLIAHRDALHPDIENLTKTGQTLSKNVNRLAHTGHWASRLFHAAQRAVDYQKNWLRLNNQGQALEALIMMRLKQRLTELCSDLGLPDCSQPSYWAQNVPSMFCFKDHCQAAPKLPANPVDQLTEAINQVPELVNTLLEKAQKIVCDDAPNPQNCVKRKALLIKCAQADDTRKCLEDNAVLLKCLRRTTIEGVRRCVEQHKNDDVRELVDDLLKQTLGNPDLTSPGVGGGT